MLKRSRKKPFVDLKKKNRSELETTEKEAFAEELIGALARYGNVLREDAAFLARGARTMRLLKNESLFEPGQPEDALYYMREGVVKAVFLEESGAERVVRFFFAPEFVTEYPALVAGAPGRFALVAVSDLSLVRIPSEQLYALYDRSHAFERIGRLVAEQEFAEALAREMDFLLLTPEARYLKLARERPEYVAALPVKDLAAYLGIRPESLSRIRARYRAPRKK